MAYDRWFNNVLTIWTAFNGIMNTNVKLEYETTGPFEFMLRLDTNTGLTYTIKKITCSSEYYINWGDGTVDTFAATTTQPKHTYTAIGTYTVSITGAITDLSFANGTQSSWSTYNALYKVLTQFPNTMSSNKDMSYRFCHCNSLVSIPSDMFYNCIAAEDFSYCFCGCTALTVPAGLFSKNTNALNFSGLFYSCKTGPVSIPDGLFDFNTRATTFYRCFAVCQVLQSIPSGLFRYNTEAVNFSNCFYQCYALTSIPTGLFDTNTKAGYFDSCFGNCKYITAIPNGLFSNNIAVTTFASCFVNCSALTGIPSGLFNTNTQVTTFTSCFNGCSGIKAIPTGLFHYNTTVTSFDRCFYSCYGITSIPEGLFDTNIAVTTFTYCFYNCKGLTTAAAFPSMLFENNTAVTCFDYCFHRSSSSSYGKVPSISMYISATEATFTSFWSTGSYSGTLPIKTAYIYQYYSNGTTTTKSWTEYSKRITSTNGFAIASRGNAPA